MVWRGEGVKQMVRERYMIGNKSDISFFSFSSFAERAGAGVPGSQCLRYLAVDQGREVIRFLGLAFY
jgi:hypothetical protein